MAHTEGGDPTLPEDVEALLLPGPVGLVGGAMAYVASSSLDYSEIVSDERLKPEGLGSVSLLDDLGLEGTLSLSGSRTL